MQDISQKQDAELFFQNRKCYSNYFLKSLEYCVAAPSKVLKIEKLQGAETFSLPLVGNFLLLRPVFLQECKLVSKCITPSLDFSSNFFCRSRAVLYISLPIKGMACIKIYFLDIHGLFWSKSDYKIFSNHTFV